MAGAGQRVLDGVHRPGPTSARWPTLPRTRSRRLDEPARAVQRHAEVELDRRDAPLVTERPERLQRPVRRRHGLVHLPGRRRAVPSPRTAPAPSTSRRSSARELLIGRRSSSSNAEPGSLATDGLYRQQRRRQCGPEVVAELVEQLPALRRGGRALRRRVDDARSGPGRDGQRLQRASPRRGRALAGSRHHRGDLRDRRPDCWRSTSTSPAHRPATGRRRDRCPRAPGTRPEPPRCRRAPRPGGAATAPGRRRAAPRSACSARSVR